MIRTVAIRNYYEVHGSFMNIKTDMKSTIDGVTEEELYSAIGFAPYNGFSGKEVYMIRKLFLQGNVNEALSRSGCKDRDSLNQFLIQSYNNYMEDDSRMISNYAEIIGSYLLYTVLPFLEENVNTEKAAIEFRNVLDTILEDKLTTAFKREKEGNYESLLPFKGNQKKVLDQFLKSYMPKIKVSKGIEPKIVNGTLYIPRALKSSELTEIKGLVSAALVFQTACVPANAMWELYLVGMGGNFTDLPDSNDFRKTNLYCVFSDLALMKGITIKELLEACGLKLVEYWKQYRDTKTIYLGKRKDAGHLYNGEDKVYVNNGEAVAIYDFLDFVSRLNRGTLNQIKTRKGQD